MKNSLHVPGKTGAGGLFLFIGNSSEQTGFKIIQKKQTPAV